jgi:hypothetical protein
MKINPDKQMQSRNHPEMKTKNALKQPALFFPLLLAIFPALASYQWNISEVPLHVLWRPLFLSLGCALLLMVLIKSIVQDWVKAALHTSLFILLFSSYGQVNNALEEIPFLEENPFRYGLIGLIYLAIFISGILLINRKKPASQLLWTMNAAAGVLVLIPLVQIIGHQLKPDFKPTYPGEWAPQVKPGSPAPDVYYFVLDGYARADYMQDKVGYDNTAFLQDLGTRGFYVAECSRANYNNTIIALTSTFNMQYFPELVQVAKHQGLNRTQVWRYLKPNLTLTAFESLGYQTIAFDTGYYWSTLHNIDQFLQPWADPGDPPYLTSFEYLLLKSTPLVALYGRPGGFTPSRLDDAVFPFAYHVAQQEYILDQAARIAEIDAPTFAFIHILIPHEPMVFSPKGIMTSPLYFGAGGNWPVTSAAFQKAYTNGVSYLNPRLLQIVDQIIARSDTPPIIILQGDHGFWSGTNLPILNAYYLPGQASDLLYPTISPINTFRLIFDQYFGSEMGTMDDASYLVKGIEKPVEEQLQACK